ncbi:unnamed protein product [Camellia sinensis]
MKICCRMRDDSKEFALELFDALSRRRRLNVDKISRDELYEYWSQVTDQSFDSRLQIFFDIIGVVSGKAIFGPLLEEYWKKKLEEDAAVEEGLKKL